MKRVSIASIGAVALLAGVSLAGAIPGVPSLGQIGAAIAENINFQPQLTLQLNAHKQVVQQDKQGKKVSWEALQGKAVVQPGDVLRYTLSGENYTNKPVKNLTLNQPIPKGMMYVLKSAAVDTKAGAKISYSIDGGKSFVENPTVKVTLPNGKVETRPAPATAYTNIRWSFGNSVPAKTTVNATYQVQVRSR